MAEAHVREHSFSANSRPSPRGSFPSPSGYVWKWLEHVRDVKLAHCSLCGCAQLNISSQFCSCYVVSLLTLEVCLTLSRHLRALIRLHAHDPTQETPHSESSLERKKVQSPRLASLAQGSGAAPALTTNVHKPCSLENLWETVRTYTWLRASSLEKSGDRESRWCLPSTHGRLCQLSKCERNHKQRTHQARTCPSTSAQWRQAGTNQCC